MSDEFEVLELSLADSGCDKRQVAAGTYVNGLFHVATNRCDHEGDVCPRLGMPTGEGYHLCEATHAEEVLIQHLLSIGCESDGIVWVVGHYYVCEPCAKMLKNCGVQEFRVRISK